MAKSLDELLRLKGVIASGEFSADGKLIDFRGKDNRLPQDVAELTAQFAAAVSQLLGVLAAAHTKVSGFNWVPERGWAYSGGDLTIAVGGRHGVFVKTEEADFNELFEVLIGQRRLAGARARVSHTVTKGWAAGSPSGLPTPKVTTVGKEDHHDRVCNGRTRLVEDRRSVDEYIIELLRQKVAQTLDHLGASLPNVNWARLFLAIDRLSRTGIIAIAPPQQGEYLISLTSRSLLLSSILLSRSGLPFIKPTAS